MDQVFTKKGSVAPQEVPPPSLTANTVLVLNQYSLISAGTEMSTVKSTGNNLLQMARKNPENVAKVIQLVRERGLKNAYQQVHSVLKGFYEFGSEIGYSSAGVVIDVGEDIHDVKVGDRVACAGAGIANHAELIRVPRNLLVKLSDDLDFKRASSVTLGAIAMQGVRQADLRLGESVAVVGLGLLGQITVQLLKASGCRVLGSDVDPAKVELAKEFGADQAINATQSDLVQEANLFSNGRGVDAVILTAATDSSELINQSMKACRRKGKVVIVGAIGMNLQREDFYKKEIDLRISCSYGPGRYDATYETNGQDYPYAYVRWTENRNMEEYLTLVKENKINVHRLLTHEFPLEQATAAYEKIKDASEMTLGVVLKYPEYKDAHSGMVEKRSVLNSGKKSVSGHIGVGVIGCGGFASSTHLPNLQRLATYYNLVAVADINGAVAEKSSIQFGADYSTSDVEKIFSDERIDMVIITTRHNDHAKLVVKALEHGKAVLVEKPLAMTHDDLEQVKQAYERNPKPLLVGFNRRFSPLVTDIQSRLQHRKNPMIMNYRMNAGYIPLDHWVHGSEGGGRIIGEACHIYDLFHALTDSVYTDVSAFSIDTKTEYYSHSDNVVSSVKFQDGSVGNLIYTALGSSEVMKEQFDVYCEGKIYSVLDYKELRVYGGKGNKKLLGQEKGHLEELEAFAKQLTGGAVAIPFSQLVGATEISLKVHDLAEQR